MLQIDGDFAIDLFGELARAYLAAINTRSQVMTICVHNISAMLLEYCCRIVVHLLFKSSYHYLIVQILMKIGELCSIHLDMQYCVKSVECQFLSDGARIWSLLQDDTREVLRPHLNST